MTGYTGPKPLNKDAIPLEWHHRGRGVPLALITQNYIYNYGRYLCCGVMGLYRFHHTPFHKTSHETMLQGSIRANYMIEAYLLLSEANKIWEREGWAPTTWHKELILYGFKLVEVYKVGKNVQLYYRYEPWAEQVKK